MKFQFVAYNEEGEVRRGVLEALDVGHVEEALAADGFRLAVIKKRRDNPWHGLSLRQHLSGLFSIKSQDIINLSRSLSTLLGSGTAIISALDLLKDQASNLLFRKLIEQLQHDLASGRSLAWALSRHPKQFSTIYVRVVATAEETGGLADALEDLANHMEREAAIRRRLAQTLMYPAFVAAVGAVVLTVVFTVTLPQLTTLFSGFGVALPLPTRILIATIGFVGSNKLLLLAGLLTLVLVAVLAPKSPVVRKALHRAVLKAPLLGRVLLTADLSRFLLSLGRLLRAGALLPDAVDLASQTVMNLHLRAALNGVRQELIRGRGLAGPLARCPILPRMLVHFVKIGEDAGTLEANITRMGIVYDRELEERSKTLMGLVEPGLTVLLGGGVAFVAISVIMPIYSIISEVGNAAIP